MKAKIIYQLLISVTTLLCISSGANSLTFMSINAEWFWDNEPKHEGKVGPDKDIKPPTLDEFEAEAFAYANLILANGVDVVALIEVENEKVPDKVLEYLPVGWSAVFKKGRDYGTGQDVAILTRLKVDQDSITNFKSLPNDGEFKRPSKILGVRLMWGDSSYYVIAVHLISKFHKSISQLNQKNADRLKQAKSIGVGLSDVLNKESNVIMLGDFNDTPNSPPLIELHRSGLVSVATENDYSYVFEGKRELIDNILISPSLTPKNYKLYTIHVPKWFSDHRAVVLTDVNES